MSDLFEFPPYQGHSDTSFAAAIAIQPKTGTLRHKVLEYLRDCPRGATDKEIQAGLDLGGSTQRPRRVELVEGGLVKDSGVRRDRSVVWVVA